MIHPIDACLGVVSIGLFPVPAIIFAIAYRRADGSQYGDLLRNGFIDGPETPMVLKMVKPRILFTTGPNYPSLRPFDSGISQYFRGRGLPVPDSIYLFSELYDTLWTVAQQSARNRYITRGRAIFD